MYSRNKSLIINVMLNGSSISSDGAGVEIDGSKATISRNYNISGKLTNGQIIVDTKDDQ